MGNEKRLVSTARVSPGPGSYENLLIKKPPTANIGTREKRFAEIKLTVGAGQYTINGIIGREG